MEITSGFDALLSALGLPSGTPLEPVAGGLIHATWSVGDPPTHVLQRIHPIFAPETHLRLEAVTRFLHERGMKTPLLVRGVEGAPTVAGPDGALFRLLTWVDGRSYSRMPSAAHARSAGALVARFHAALADYPGDLRPLRPEAHDTPLHMRRLEETLTGCGSHRLGAEIRPLGEAVLEAWERWTSRFSGSEGASRPSHGDLKVSNIRFREACPEATCLIDLDTLGSLPLSVEMGDALRSWCNPADEDEPPRLDEEILASALRGYLHASPVLSAEVRATLIPGLWRVCLELAARFCADAFHERYFGWDPAVASGRGEHNLLRAGGQFALAGLVEARLDVLELLATRDAGPNRDRA